MKNWYIYFNVFVILFLCFTVMQLKSGMEYLEKRVETVEGYLEKDSRWQDKLEKKYPKIYQEITSESR